MMMSQIGLTSQACRADVIGEAYVGLTSQACRDDVTGKAAVSDDVIDRADVTACAGMTS